MVDAIAIVPARSGSKGLSGKNIRPFLGRPLLDWSLLVAERCQSIGTTVLSSDSEDFLTRAIHFPKAKGIVRPAHLADDHSPMSGVIAHATAAVSELQFDYVVLLDPTSPFRNPSEVEAALDNLRQSPSASGVVSVSQPHFNMRWVGVDLDEGGEIKRAFPGGGNYVARQYVPPLWRMNGTFYIWRRGAAENLQDPWLEQGRYLGAETPEERAFSIDTLEEFTLAETLAQAGLVEWEVDPFAYKE
jgi:CMP-N,N'-diacetyllegionaminic acid synthase